MVICPTTDEGFFIHFERRGVVMRCRKNTRKEAEEIHRVMQEDPVVDLPRKRVYFQENQTLILKKPNITDPQFRDPYEKLTDIEN
jgi:hypothetical protein